MQIYGSKEEFFPCKVPGNHGNKRSCCLSLNTWPSSSQEKKKGKSQFPRFKQRHIRSFTCSLVKESLEVSQQFEPPGGAADEHHVTPGRVSSISNTVETLSMSIIRGNKISQSQRHLPFLWLQLLIEHIRYSHLRV